MSLKSLSQVNASLAQILEAIQSKNLSYEEEYVHKYKVISDAVRAHFEPLPLTQYFDRSKKLATSKNLIRAITCDRETWKIPGKFSRPSLPDICDNIYKTRAIDRENGVCITLFHEAGLIAMKDHGSFLDKLGRDEIQTEDPQQMRKISSSIESPLFQLIPKE